MRIRPGWLAGVTLTLALVAAPFLTAQTQPPGSVVTSAATGERVLRSWHDKVKIRGHDEARTVEIVYDYDAGVARRRTYDADGELILDQILAAQPQPNREEIEEAFSVVRNDTALGALARQVRARFDGGFILDEAKGEPCGPGTRCLQVFMHSQSRWGLQRHSAVDLRSRRIAHRSYRSGRTD